MSQGIKNTTEVAYYDFCDYGLFLLEDYVRNSHRHHCINEDGYHVLANLGTVKSGGTPSVFYESNPFTINNIETWLIRKDSKIKLKKNQKYIKSDKAMTWICPTCGDFEQSWDCIRRGQLCPYCAGRRVKIGYNDINTTHPNLVKYFKTEDDAICSYQMLLQILLLTFLAQ